MDYETVLISYCIHILFLYIVNEYFMDIEKYRMYVSI